MMIIMVTITITIIIVLSSSPSLCLLNAIVLHLLIAWNRLVPVAISFFYLGFLMDKPMSYIYHHV